MRFIVWSLPVHLVFLYFLNKQFIIEEMLKVNKIRYQPCI